MVNQCEWCKVQWEGRKKKYCSLECRRKTDNQKKKEKYQTAVSSNTCVQCGKEWRGRKQRYCSLECRRVASNARLKQRNRATGAQPAEEMRAEKKRKYIKQWTRICKQCGESFLFRIGGRTTLGSGSFCSRACYFDNKREQRDAHRPGPFCSVWFNQCKECKQWFRAKNGRSTYCSDECRKAYECQRYAKYAKQKKGYEIKFCKECNKEFIPVYGSKRRTFCSELCAKRYSRKLKKRIEKFGGVYQSIDPIKVLDRDKWTCQICKGKTPKKLRGTNESNAPEIDHIVPISKGGWHVYENVQCTCRQCNNKKRATTNTGQMFLDFSIAAS